MKAPPFRYHAPRSKQDALDMLAGLDNARLLAGGQSLMPMLNFRLLSPDHVIDINRVAELSGISADAGVLHIGAMSRQRELEHSTIVATHAPLLQAALAHVGHPQTRNRGTLGGSLCHLDPAAELVTAAAALEADLVAESKRGERRIAFARWSEGYLSNALQQGEMLTRAEFPLWPRGHGYAFSEYARRNGDFAIVGVAVLLTLAPDATIDRAAIAVGGCAAAPQRLPGVEQRLAGARADAVTFKDAARMTASLEAVSDPYVPAAYRRHLARVMTERALVAAAGRAVIGASA